VLPGPDLREDDDAIATLRADLDATLTLHEAEAFAPGAAAHRLREQFGDGAVESVGLEAAAPAVQAAGATLDYVETTGAGVLASFTRLQRYRDREHVALDATTQRNLELTETMQGDREGSLLATIDETVTSPGRRRLGEWLARPRRDRETISTRLDAVDALGSSALARERLREELSEASDLARLASKATHGSADAGDLLRVRDALDVLPAAEAVIEEFGLQPWTIPASENPGQGDETQTVTTSIILFADESLDEEVAYTVTRAMIDHSDAMGAVSDAMKRFTPEGMLAQDVLPFHPGAIRAYEEAGLM